VTGAGTQTTHTRTPDAAGVQAELLPYTPPAYTVVYTHLHTALVSQASHSLSTSCVGAYTPVSHGTQLYVHSLILLHAHTCTRTCHLWIQWINA